MTNRFSQVALLSTLLLTACSQGVSAQQAKHSNEGAIAEMTIEETCAKLSKERAQDYKVVSGELIDGRWKDDGVDDWSGTHPYRLNFVAEMRPIENGTIKPGGRLHVTTPFVAANRKDPRKPPLMENGKRYKFCAYEAERKHAEAAAFGPGEMYGLDALETIQEIK